MAYLEEKSQEMLKRCEQLYSALKLYEGNYQGNHAMLTKLKILSGKIENLDSLMNKNKQNIEKHSLLTIKSQDLANQMCLLEEHETHLIENIPDTMPENISLQSNGGNSYFDNNYLNVNSTVSSVASPIPDSWKDLKSPSPCLQNKNRLFNVLGDQTNFMGHNEEKPKPVANRIVPSKPSVPSILPFCENELKQVPVYLKGRLTCAQINEVIDAMNSVLELKYSMIKKKFTQIKNTDKVIYSEWKEQDRQTVRGQYFITQSDLIAYGHIQMCKRTINIITILSNARKIKKEHMNKSNVKYIVVTN